MNEFAEQIIAELQYSESVQYVSERHIITTKRGPWFSVDHLTNDDDFVPVIRLPGAESEGYRVPLVLQSNFEVIMDNLDEYGGAIVRCAYTWSTGYTLFIRLDKANEECLNLVIALMDFDGALDNDNLSDLESRIEAESWEAWGRADLMRELHKVFDIDPDWDDGTIDAAFNEARTEFNLMTEWEDDEPYYPGLYDVECLQFIYAFNGLTNE